MKRSTLLLLLALAVVAGLARVLWPTETSPETGYAGLGERAEGFAQASPDNALNFPEDHGPHPDYRIEWWYLTANLKSADGRPFGVQWTLFRQAMAPETVIPDEEPETPWQSRQLWMAHAAVSTPDGHRFAEKFARGMALPDRQGQANVTASPFAAWIDDWALTANHDDDEQGINDLTVRAKGADFAYELTLSAEEPLVRHGVDGFSQKSADGQGSMYYSQPFYDVSGKLRIDDERVTVTGKAWLDREWSSQLLGPNQRGWDWFSLHLADGTKLMAFRLRGGGENAKGDYLSGSWITPEGQVTSLTGEALKLTPLDYREVAGRQLPTTWQVEVANNNLDVTVTTRHPEQWMGTSFPYWEGMVTVEGSHSGEGYLEMTGY